MRGCRGGTERGWRRSIEEEEVRKVFRHCLLAENTHPILYTDLNASQYNKHTLVMRIF